MTSELGVEAPTFQLSFSYELNDRRLEWRRPEPRCEPDVPVDLHWTSRMMEKNSLCVCFITRNYSKRQASLVPCITSKHCFAALHRIRISGLGPPILTEQEQRQMVVEWNQNIQDYASNKCLHELLEEMQSARLPDLRLFMATTN